MYDVNFCIFWNFENICWKYISHISKPGHRNYTLVSHYGWDLDHPCFDLEEVVHTQNLRIVEMITLWHFEPLNHFNHYPIWILDQFEPLNTENCWTIWIWKLKMNNWHYLTIKLLDLCTNLALVVVVGVFRGEDPSTTPYGL